MDRMRAIGIIVHWLPVAAAVVLLGGMGVAMGQQAMRSQLNDPQIEMVADGVMSLEGGAQPADVAPAASSTPDAAHTFAPFIAVYDAQSNPLAWTGTINGEAPKPPVGVFESAKSNGYDRVTWQPDKDTRIALVVRPVKNGEEYVAAGRNMAEVEERIWIMTQIGLASVGLILLITLVLEAFGNWWRRKTAA